ncbi:universal stress protein [Paracoccus fistulariae]|uniref:Universal stress protein n=1 Tax=Paracoccus fistulariae TaxID=658446 RepID=A0ABY7SJC1_9RHOB|nr:universal stress protein [Paracoccus fistulariae]MDB6180794.1 universal stress protein [Paracoccus fistulariae]WCR06985.1 universal stress protein [Paracoccus fistulariae]
MTSATSPRKILVPLDSSSEHNRSRFFDFVEQQALSGDASIVFLTVVPELFMSTVTDPEGMIETMIKHATHEQAAMLSQRWPDLPSDQRLVRYGPVAGTIIDTAEEISADLIVMRARRPGVASYALGSVASRVVNHAQASVLVIRNDGASE